MSKAVNDSDPLVKMGRFLEIDAFRGLLIVLITITHSHTVFSGRLHLRIFSFCSAAEGFVFLSGLTAGLVYFRRLKQGGSVFDRFRIRLRRLYMYHLGIWGATIVLAPLLLSARFTIHELPLDWLREFYEDPQSSFWRYAMLLDQPPLMDILPLYMGTSLLLPFLLMLLRARRFRTVLLLSIGAWLPAQFGVEPLAFLCALIGVSGRQGFALLLAWQLLFVLGVLSAYAGLEELVDFESALLTRISGGIVLVCCLMEMVCVVTRFHNPPHTELLWFHALADVKHLGLLRLLNFLALAQLCFKFRQFLASRVSKLSLIGRCSLQAFSVSAVLVNLLAVLQVTSGREQFTLIGLFVFDSICVALIIWAVWVTAQWMERRRHRVSTNFEAPRRSAEF